MLLGPGVSVGASRFCPPRRVRSLGTRGDRGCGCPPAGASAVENEKRDAVLDVRFRRVAAGPQTYGVLARLLALVYKNNASSYNTYTALTIVWRELGCVSGYV